MEDHAMDRRTFLTGAAMAAGALSETDAAAAIRLRLTATNAGVVARDGEKPLLAYHAAEVAGPAGTGPLFTRSGYIHPVHAPNGAVVTDDFPADHLHQRGV